MNDNIKHCPKCNKDKSIIDFYKDKQGKMGLSAYCRVCRSAMNNKWKEVNPEKAKEKQTQRTLKFLYNFTIEGKELLFEKQNGKCAICEKTLDSASKAHLDHNHKTKEIRGLLCHNCNRGIGYLKDNIDILQKAIQYLINF